MHPLAVAGAMAFEYAYYASTPEAQRPDIVVLSLGTGAAVSDLNISPMFSGIGGWGAAIINVLMTASNDYIASLINVLGKS